MRKLFALPLAALTVGLVACDESSSLMAPDELNIGVSSPGTAVEATAQITGPEQTIVTYRSTPRGNAGSCNPANGDWTQNDKVHPEHNQCTDIETVPGFAIEIEFAMVANYVQPPSGNIHLNFSMCGYTEVEIAPEEYEWQQTPCTAPTYIHYKHNKKTNAGVLNATGVLTGIDENGDIWTIDFAQIDGSPGRMGLDPTEKTFILRADGPDGAVASATLEWK